MNIVSKKYSTHKASGDRTILFNRINQSQIAGFSKRNYYRKIDKNQRKNIKFTKIDR